MGKAADAVIVAIHLPTNSTHKLIFCSAKDEQTLVIWLQGHSPLRTDEKAEHD